MATKVSDLFSPNYTSKVFVDEFHSIVDGLTQKYVIKRNGKRFNNKYFHTYEGARQYVRKWLRKRLGASAYLTPDGTNPTMGKDGFTIVKK